MSLINELPVGPLKRVTMGELVTTHAQKQVGPTVVRTSVGTWVVAGQGMVLANGDDIVRFETWEAAGNALVGNGLGNFYVQHNPPFVVV